MYEKSIVHEFFFYVLVLKNGKGGRGVALLCVGKVDGCNVWISCVHSLSSTTQLKLRRKLNY